MERLALGGVPLHPALVHFPVVFWVLVPFMDLAYWFGWGASYWQLSWLLSVLGLASAVPAMIAGALDAWASQSVAAAEGTVWLHAGLMGSAWTLFGLAALFCSPADSGQAALFGTAMHVLGTLTLIAGAHAGGRLAYVHRLPRTGQASDGPKIDQRD